MNSTCRRDGDQLHLSTGRITCTFRWNEGHLIGERLSDSEGGIAWELAGAAPDAEFPAQTMPPAVGRLEVFEQEATATTPAHLRAEVTTRLGALELKRVFRLYPGCPAIGCDLFLRGRAEGDWQRDAKVAAADLDNIESAAAARQGRPALTVMHRLLLPHLHLDVEAVQFFDITDRRNNLVARRAVQPYRQPILLAGNLLLVRDRLAPRALFLLKEAPCSDVQLAWPGCDFLVRGSEVQVVGIGLTPADLNETTWTRGYGFALGLALPGAGAGAGAEEGDLLRTLRQYQDRLRLRRPERDDMILMNTWGDRGQGARVTEEGTLEEIRRGARLGITHLQLDHGWESTQDPARPWPLGLKRIWDTPHFWEVNPMRFPRGLGPCVQAARAAGIELCLWFNPSPEDDYAHWRDDANVLLGLHRAHGIRTFKIDGVQIPTKGAEANFRRLLDTVMEGTGGEAVFNLDITAGQRFGYHSFNEYGNKFLENRYTDWANHYPHWTLRNLWQLARYLPAQSLQIEFLNHWRNAEKYPADDPLAPRHVPFDYLFAITMMAQPLAWFEAANLPEEAFALGELVRTYRNHMAAIHAGCILPIGEEPSGVGWTGFQSLGADGRGYLLVFRERNDRPQAALPTWGLAGRRVRCAHIAGSGAVFEAHPDAEGRLRFALPGPFTFALYAYTAG